MGRSLCLRIFFNLSFAPAAKFVRPYADGAAFFGEALARYREDVAGRGFPNDAESYHLPREVREQLDGLKQLENFEAVQEVSR